MTGDQYVGGVERAHRTDVDAIVYDLDGTLVRLAVDWATVEREVGTILDESGASVDGMSLWEMLDVADETDGAAVSTAVEETIAARERDGARRSTRLPLADALADADVPVGVCSLNCEAACRIALDTHGLAEYVDVVVGRDSVATRKPDPDPLLAAVRALSSAPERALFVGDSESDEATANAAGTAFEYV